MLKLRGRSGHREVDGQYIRPLTLGITGSQRIERIPPGHLDKPLERRASQALAEVVGNQWLDVIQAGERVKAGRRAEQQQGRQLGTGQPMGEDQQRQHFRGL